MTYQTSSNVDFAANDRVVVERFGVPDGQRIVI